MHRERPPTDIIDAEVVATLRGLPDVWPGALDEFARECATRIPLLRSASATGDWPIAQRMAHALKGAAGSLGAVALADVLAEAEAAAKAGDAEALRDRCQRIAPLWQQSEAALRRAGGG